MKKYIFFLVLVWFVATTPFIIIMEKRTVNERPAIGFTYTQPCEDDPTKECVSEGEQIYKTEEDRDQAFDVISKWSEERN